MVKFSERIGADEPRKGLQVDSMRDEFRNSLWNQIFIIYNEKFWPELNRCVAVDFRKSPLDELPPPQIRPTRSLNENIRWLKEYFYSLLWFQVYDLIEFLVKYHENIVRGAHSLERSDLYRFFNRVFEEELSGYRFVHGELTPITDKSEIAEIETTLDSADKHGLYGVKEHIRTAMELLGKKPTPEYRNAIKEAISSVESIARQIAGNDSPGLKDALNELAAKTNIHGALKSGFNSLYGYTSDENGIRHAILEESDIGFAEAKYMIVSCSAFVNYLIQKADNAGLLKSS